MAAEHLSPRLAARISTITLNARITTPAIQITAERCTAPEDIRRLAPRCGDDPHLRPNHRQHRSTPSSARTMRTREPPAHITSQMDASNNLSAKVNTDMSDAAFTDGSQKRQGRVADSSSTRCGRMDRPSRSIPMASPSLTKTAFRQSAGGQFLVRPSIPQRLCFRWMTRLRRAAKCSAFAFSLRRLTDGQFNTVVSGYGG